FLSYILVFSFSSFSRLFPCFSSSSSFFHAPPPHPHLHSFPTRRSSDLTCSISPRNPCRHASNCSRVGVSTPSTGMTRRRRASSRSEEHTSELQSRRDLVCRLLLEKKKKTKKKKKESNEEAKSEAH